MRIKLFVLALLFSSCCSFLRLNSIQKKNKFLEEIYFWDHYVRQPKNYCSDKEVNIQDSIDLQKVERFIVKYGFPASKKYSTKAIDGVYYTIQHSNLKTQKKYFGLISQLCDSGFISRKKYAMTYDRILVGTIGKQKYGEQMFIDTTTFSLKYFPFINKDSVQIFRNQLGLDSLDFKINIRIIKK